jgi:hypothetical protein
MFIGSGILQKSESMMINDRDMPTWKLITLKKQLGTRV